MSIFTLNTRSLSRLEGVHSDLVKVVKLAVEYSKIEFIVTEGKRTLERQKQLFAKGASKTLHSRHIPDSTGICHAVDLAALVDGKISWGMQLYREIEKAMRYAAKKLYITIESGINWKMFPDGPHHQLPLALYPNK
jgi:peptidoglycan L-alanyl-D-glutamate endopeptidase CwlK